MLEKYVHELERVAPQHRETARAKAVLARSKPGLARTVLGGLLVFLPVLGTIGHAIWRVLRLRPRGAPAATVAAMLAFAMSVMAVVPARAEETPQSTSAAQEPPAPTPKPGNIAVWPIDDKDPESSVPSEAKRDRDPVEFGYWLQDLTAKGQQAARLGDHEAAVRYFRALVKAVPDRAIGMSRLCDEYEAIGQREKALAACKVAIQMEGVTFHDYVHYVTLMLDKPGTYSAAELADLKKVMEHLREDPGVAGDVYGLECRLSVRTSDIPGLERCVADAKVKAPEAPQTLVYEWDLALAQGKYGEARDLIEKARSKGANAPAIERMEREMRSKATAHQRLVVFGLLFALCAVAAASAGVPLARRRSHKSPPAGPVAPADVRA
jgi:hypothetical protein